MLAHTVGYQLLYHLDTLAAAGAQDLSLPADHQNIGIQNLRQYLTDVVKYYLAGAVVMQQLIDLSRLV